MTDSRYVAFILMETPRGRKHRSTSNTAVGVLGKTTINVIYNLTLNKTNLKIGIQ